MGKVEGTFQATSWDDRTVAFSFTFELRDDECYVKTVSGLSAKRLRYKLVLYFPAEDRRVLLYDNFYCDEPHIHIGESNEKIPYAFQGVRKLLEDFANDVELATGLEIYEWVEKVERILLENHLYHPFL